MNNKKSFSGKALVVDDNEVNHMIARKNLESVGLKVDVATNGKQAISCCRDNVYQLVLMDMEMPLMDGVQAARIIREKLLCYAPIIALTGNDTPQSRARCKNERLYYQTQ